MQHKVKFIYFDLGGVFFHWRQSLQRLAKDYKKNLADFERVFSKYDNQACRGKITAQMHWQKSQSELNLQGQNIPDFIEYWADSFRPIKETHLLAQILVEKYPLGILTNIYAGVLPKLIEKKHVPQINFTARVESCYLGFIKPEKQIFLYAQKLAQVKPREIFFIDDSKINIQMAKKLNWKAILFDEANPQESIKNILKNLG